MDLALPPLSDEPTRYPDFCLSLSNPLIHSLTKICNEAAAKSSSSLVLSVGSGSGLLEAHLQSLWSSTPSSDLLVHGVEVQTPDRAHPVNRYLPEQNYSTVRGTSQLAPDFGNACALLFVYPRDPKLLLRYLQAAKDVNSSPLQAVVWLGPRADYAPFAGYLQSALETILGDHLTFSPVEIVEVCGMAEYEMMAVIRRDAAAELPAA
ncbi:unnamed protein product [Discula destructiva]